MKQRTADLSGALLDAAVAKAEGRECLLHHYPGDGSHPVTKAVLVHRLHFGGTREESYYPSSRWEVGGPILHRERIGIEPGSYDTGNWMADMVHPARPDGVQRTFTTGATPLEAAMRAYVASRLGDEVDL